MDIIDSLAFILSGFTVVLVALSLLWMVCALTGQVLARGAGRKTPAAPPPAPATPGTPGTQPPTGIPPAHVAAISAAIAAMTGGRGRIVSVRAPAHLASSWAREGRTEQFSSHRVRWDWAVTGPPHIDHDATPTDSTPAPAAPGKRTP